MGKTIDNNIETKPHEQVADNSKQPSDVVEKTQSNTLEEKTETPQSNNNLICYNCNKVSAKTAFEHCKQCKCTHYCSKQCQKQHWPDHKPICEAIHQLELHHIKVNNINNGIHDTRFSPAEKSAAVKLVGKRCLINCSMNDTKTKCLYDTGSQICLSSENWLYANIPEAEIHPLTDPLSDDL